MRLTYDVEYYTYAPDAEDVTLVPFETADIRHSLNGDQAAAEQAHDTVELPQV
jgi:hypothetical protein